MRKVNMKKSSKITGRKMVKVALLVVLLTVGLATRAYASETAVAAPNEPPTVEAPAVYALDYTEAITWGGDMGHEAWYALLFSGAGTGAVNDGTDDMLYVPIGTVVAVENGTATVTAYGLAFCVDGEQMCTGDEFRTPEFLTASDDVPGTVNA